MKAQTKKIKAKPQSATGHTLSTAELGGPVLVADSAVAQQGLLDMYSHELLVRIQDQALLMRAGFLKSEADVASLRRECLGLKAKLDRVALQSVSELFETDSAPPVSLDGDARFISDRHIAFDYENVTACLASWNITQEVMPDKMDYLTWSTLHGRPVTIVIPSYNDTNVLRACLVSLARVIATGKNRIIIADDASPSSEHQAFLNAINDPGITVIRNMENGGFARNVNSALALIEDEDVVLLNSDVEAEGFWLEALQYACYASNSGIVGPKLLYPDRRVQHSGVHRNMGHPLWFDHYGRFAPESDGPSSIPSWMMAVTGACLYISNAAFRAVGLLDPAFPMAYEDVDYCLRAWCAGYRVLYYPYARLVHHESVTRGREIGVREQKSQDHFWSKWSSWFDERNVRTDSGKIRIIYVLEDTGIAGGHRNIFDQMNILNSMGFSVELYALAGAPAWYDLQVPVSTFPDYGALVNALSNVEAIKVATWWNTAEAVWLASVLKGKPAYLVSDIESSYYVDDDYMRAKVLAHYKKEFSYFTICKWNIDKLSNLGIKADLVSCSVDRDAFFPIGLPREQDVLLAPGRRNHLKNFQFTLDTWARLGADRPKLWMYGGEPTIAQFIPKTRYFYKPSDHYLNVLINRASAFVLTSRHEGFALTILEAMSAGTPVITTDCHGNRDFCKNLENCLMIEDGDYAALAKAIRLLMADRDLCQQIAERGIQTAGQFSRLSMGRQLKSFFEKVAG